MATKRWNAAKEGKVLGSLFENGIADPRFSKANEIDPIKEMREEFKPFSAQQFRNNYKTTATNWMAGKAIEGTRLKSLNLENSEEIQGDELLFEEPEEEIEDVIMTTSQNTNKVVPKSNVVAIAATGGYKYKPDEKKWDAVHQSSKFISKGYHREELIIEPPASFDGSEGTYQASFDNDNEVFVLKIAPNPVLNDPHAINSYYANEYGIVTADDSARNQAFHASAKHIADKWYTFRHKLDWKGKPSEDLGRWWLDYTDIKVEGRSFPLLIVQISSIKPIETRVQKMSGKLTKKTFLTPDKKKQENIGDGGRAAVIEMLREIFPVMSADAKLAAAGKYGLTPDQIESLMDVDEAVRPNKRDRSGE